MTRVSARADRRGLPAWATALAVLGLAGIAAVLLFPSEERVVKKRVSSLAQALNIPAGEGDIPRLARAQRVRRHLASDLTVHFEEGGWPVIHGRDAVAGLVARPWPGVSEGITVEVGDLTARVEGDIADARFRVRVVAANPSSEPATLDGRMVALTLQKVEGEWLVSSARIMGSDDAER